MSDVRSPGEWPGRRAALGTEPAALASHFQKKGRASLGKARPWIMSVGSPGSRCGDTPSAPGAGTAGGLGTAARLGSTTRLGAAAGAAVLAATAEKATAGTATRLGGAAGRSGATGRLGGTTGRLGSGAARLGGGTTGLSTAAVAAGPATTEAGGRGRVNGHEADDGDSENHRRKYGKTLHENLLMTNLTG
jgi:hypothetical protein